MMLRRFLTVLGLAMAAQAGLFAVYYRDLIALRREPTALADRPSAFSAVAQAALSRPRLTRRHLETIAEGARSSRHAEIEVQALARLAELAPEDPSVALRYGDALRRAGRYDAAARVFQQLVDRTYGREGTQ
jgi:Flp pilus assembly protein TadD